MSNAMAIFQDVDRCTRCRGCVIGCKRTWKMRADIPGEHKTSADSRVIIKSQKRVDNGPFIRFSCWHCPDPPCVKRCPFGALTKHKTSTGGFGAVSIDPTKCEPDATNEAGVKCTRQCVADCQRGGYPKVGVGSYATSASKAWKCTMCYGRAGSEAQVDPDTWGDALPNNQPRDASGNADLRSPLDPSGNEIPELAHWPACVYTCPTKAMKWDTVENIRNRIATGGYMSYCGDGGVYWASQKYILSAPKADPFVEDHVTPLISDVLTKSISKAALVPTIVAGGLLAVIARRQINAGDTTTNGEG